MQDEYPADEGVRLRSSCGSEEAGVASGRLLLCTGCRGQVIICSCCDRGQIYCNRGCAVQARRRTLQAAGRRYQSSQRGRLRHAARMGRYRSRQKKVTHHGSPAPATSDLLTPVAMAAVRDDVPAAAGLRPPEPHCHWCGEAAARHCCVRGCYVGAGVIASALDTTRRSPEANGDPA